MKKGLALALLIGFCGGCAMTPQQQAFWREYSQRAHERELAEIYAGKKQQEDEWAQFRSNLNRPGSYSNPIHVQIDPY